MYDCRRQEKVTWSVEEEKSGTPTGEEEAVVVAASEVSTFEGHFFCTVVHICSCVTYNLCVYCYVNIVPV